MAGKLSFPSLIDALRNRGDARETARWPNGTPDYVAEYSLTADHVAALISLATEWVNEPSDNDAVYGPVHAWRALAQLRAVEAIQPLLEVQDKLDELGDDWYLEEFHHVFGLIGPAAIQPLAAFLRDESHREFPRANAGNGLRQIACRFPDTREQIVRILTNELARNQKELPSLNGLLVGDLIELKAIEAAETIERAFAANVIDPQVTGHWGNVREELGVAGKGIAPDRSPGWPSPRERFGFVDVADQRRRLRRERKTQLDARRRDKAKRKQKMKNRKRNRTPR